MGFAPPPTDLFTKYTHHRSRAARCIAFIEGECIVPFGRHVGHPYRLLGYQKRAIRRSLSDTRVLVSLLSAPRGWGKTGLLAAMVVWALFDREGAQVMAVSTGMRTARQAYDRAVRIIALNPRLQGQALTYHNAANPYVELPQRGAQLFPLPSEEKHIIGMSPTFVLVDELGYVTRSTYETMQSSLGKAPGSLLLGIGTPGLSALEADGSNVMHELVSIATGDACPPELRATVWAARPGDDPSKVATWKRANPGLGRLVEVSAVALDHATLGAARFGQMRLGLWTESDASWIGTDEWDALRVEEGQMPAGCGVTIGFDGSVSGDATALVAYELASARLVVLGLWEPPPRSRGWRVPRKEVRLVIEAAMARYAVVALYYDPYYWRDLFDDLAEVYGDDRIVEFRTSTRQRMAPATDAFRTAVATGALCTDGHRELRAHVLRAVATQTPAGDVIVKDQRKPQRIDLAIAAILAHEAARVAEVAPSPAIW